MRRKNKKRNELNFNRALQTILLNKEKMLRKILAQYLQREPTTEDAKRTTLANYDGEPERTGVAYDNVMLGDLIFKQDNKGATFKFIPNIKK